jgi:hypothetical protein
VLEALPRSSTLMESPASPLVNAVSTCLSARPEPFFV